MLALAKNYPFARALVNSGRLSLPATLHDSVLNTPDVDVFQGRMVPGSAALDAPVQLSGGDASWLLGHLSAGFTLLVYAAEVDAAFEASDTSAECAIRQIAQASEGTSSLPDALIDRDGLIAKRYDMQPGTAYLLRPDQHVCARWRRVTPEKLQAALNRALVKI